jgi:outer membrane lipoprotein-sorting protein
LKTSNRRELRRLPSDRAVSFKISVTLSGALFVLAAVVLPAFAQAIPVPKAAPKSRDATDAPRAKPPSSEQSTQEPPNPIIPDLRSLFGSGPAPAVTFNANQKILASKVSAYLSSLNNVAGNFVQVGPDGSRTTGDFYIQKPGKLRFEYDAPSPIALIADGTTLAVRDSKLATQDIYPLSQTPLRYLLSEKIDLMKDTNVVGVSADDIFVSITIEEKQALVGTSRLMLMVGAKDYQLKQWTVTDPQGYDTTVAVYNLDTSKKLDPNMFKIDFTNYQNTTNN